MKTWGQSVHQFSPCSILCVLWRREISLPYNQNHWVRCCKLWDIKHRCNALQMVRLSVSSWNGWTSTFFMGVEEYQLPPFPYAMCTNAHTAILLHGKRVHLVIKPIGIGRCFRELIYSGFLHWSLKHTSSSTGEIWHLLRLLSFSCLKLKIFFMLMKRLWNLKFKLEIVLEIYCV